MENKKWFESKVVLVNILMGVAMIVAVFNPQIGDFIKQHFSEAGSAWAIVNVVLRIFKSNIELK